MKKIALLLALVMVMSLFAACAGTAGETEGTTTQATTEATTEATKDAAENVNPGEPTENNASAQILVNIWNKFDESEKFPITGGAPETYGEMIEIDENFQMPTVPADYDMKYVESLSAQLLIPAEELANIDEAGFAQGMMANSFTAGVVHVTSDAKTMAEAVHEALKNNHWMCGIPEKLLIAVVDSDYLLITYGSGMAIDSVAGHMGEAYPEAEVLYNEAIEGR